MYFRARYYNPLTGEFLSRDPLEFVDGMSLYRGYMAVNGMDPTGKWVKVAVGVVASITIAVIQSVWTTLKTSGDYFGEDFFESQDIAGECGLDKNVPELPPCPKGKGWMEWQGNEIVGYARLGGYSGNVRAQAKGRMTWEYRGNSIYNLQAFDNGSVNEIGGYGDSGHDTTSVVVFAKINKKDREYAPCACDCKTKAVALIDYGTITLRYSVWETHIAEVCSGQIKIDGQGGNSFVKSIACTTYSVPR